MAQKNEKVEDLRVRRTRRALQEALIALTVEKGFAALTVRDITERAMVNRSTFYRHYLDKEDLLKQYMEEIYQMLNDTAEDVSLVEKQGEEMIGPPDRMVEMFRQVQEHADFFRLMLGPKGDPQFVQQVRTYIEMRIRNLLPVEKLPAPPGAPPLDLALRYVSSAGVGVLFWWLESGMPCPPEQLAKWVVQYSNADLGFSFAPSTE